MKSRKRRVNVKDCDHCYARRVPHPALLRPCLYIRFGVRLTEPHYIPWQQPGRRVWRLGQATLRLAFTNDDAAELRQWERRTRRNQTRHFSLRQLCRMRIILAPQ